MSPDVHNEFRDDEGNLFCKKCGIILRRFEG
jgi:hypothetical protein